MDLGKPKIGVVGSGTMGKEICKALTENKYPLIVKSRKIDDINDIMASARKTFKKLHKRKKISPGEFEYLTDNTVGTTEFDDRFENLDIVIETIAENFDTKKRLFRELENVCSPKTVICTNTSSLSISALAEDLQHKDRFLGLHFFQPFRAFNFIEVVKGKKTSRASLEILEKLVQSLKKFPLEVVDSPGFFFNRVQLTIAVEAFLAIESGWHDIIVLNETFKASKFYTAIYQSFDKLGLDILNDCFINFHNSWEERYPLPELISDMISRKRYGEKCGKGFFSYNTSPAVIDAEMQSIVAAYRARRSSEEYIFSPEMGIVRAMNEGIYCLEDGIADMEEMERAMKSLPPFLFMDGFYRGMDKMGLDVLHQKLVEYEACHGARFHPAPLLKQKIAAGDLGVKTGKGFFQYQKAV